MINHAFIVKKNETIHDSLLDIVPPSMVNNSRGRTHTNVVSKKY